MLPSPSFGDVKCPLGLRRGQWHLVQRGALINHRRARSDSWPKALGLTGPQEAGIPTEAWCLIRRNRSPCLRPVSRLPTVAENLWPVEPENQGLFLS